MFNLSEILGADFAKKRYLIAVSGGVDSCVLLHHAAKVLPPSQLGVAHFNHATRAGDSDRDAEFVRSLAQSSGISFFSDRYTGTSFSELALRNARRAFLLSVQKTKGFDFILTAHHLDDWLETFLMRLARGTGVSGLSGILPKRGVWLSPFLNVPKARLVQYAHTSGISFCEDSTNRDPRFLRNSTRLKVVPALKHLGLEHGSEIQFYERVNALRKDQLELHRWMQRTVAHEARRAVSEFPYWTRLELRRFMKLSSYLQLLLLRRILKRLGSDDFGRRELKQLRDRILSGTRRFQTSGGIQVCSSCENVFFQSPAQIKHEASSAKLETVSHHTFEIPALRLQLSFTDLPARGALRTFLPGDTFRSTKLKKIFLEKRIARPERAHIPVLIQDEKVIWFYPQSFPGLEIKSLEF